MPSTLVASMPSFTIIDSNAVPVRMEGPATVWFQATIFPCASRPTSTRCTYMGEERHRVLRDDRLRRGLHRRRVGGLARERPRALRRGRELLAQLGRRELRVLSEVPVELERVAPFLRRPEARADDRDAVLDL